MGVIMGLPVIELDKSFWQPRQSLARVGKVFVALSQAQVLNL